MLCGRVLQKGIFAEKINRKSRIDRSNGAKKERAKGQVGVFKSTDGGERRGKNFECAARELLKSEGLP